jgi:hypothetical protein
VFWSDISPLSRNGLDQKNYGSSGFAVGKKWAF